MNINWVYYSDTNSSAEDIKAILDRKSISLTSIQKIEDLRQQVLKSDHLVLFLKANTIYNGFELCQNISILYPEIYIILMVPDNMENAKRAMQAGASDILKFSSNAEEIREAIFQADKYMNLRSNKENGHSIKLSKNNCRVLSLSSPKGGVGRTLLTVNLAASFAKQGLKVAVVDADLQFGDVSIYCDLKQKKTIYDWVKEGYGRTHYSIDQFMEKHESGISILAAPSRPEFFESISGQHIEAAIEEMKKIFDIVLIDTPAYLSEIHLSCIQKSDIVLLLALKELSVLRNSRLYLDTLETLNLKDKVRLIINRDAKNKAFDTKKLEEILGLKIEASLPDQEEAVSSSIDNGIPFVLSHSRTSIAKAVLLLAEKLSVHEKEELSTKKEKRWFLLKR